MLLQCGREAYIYGDVRYANCVRQEIGDWVEANLSRTGLLDLCAKIAEMDPEGSANESIQEGVWPYDNNYDTLIGQHVVRLRQNTQGPCDLDYYATAFCYGQVVREWGIHSQSRAHKAIDELFSDSSGFFDFSPPPFLMTENKECVTLLSSVGHVDSAKERSQWTRTKTPDTEPRIYNVRKQMGAQIMESLRSKRIEQGDALRWIREELTGYTRELHSMRLLTPEEAAVESSFVVKLTMEGASGKSGDYEVQDPEIVTHETPAATLFAEFNDRLQRTSLRQTVIPLGNWSTITYSQSWHDINNTHYACERTYYINTITGRHSQPKTDYHVNYEHVALPSRLRAILQGEARQAKTEADTIRQEMEPDTAALRSMMETPTCPLTSEHISAFRKCQCDYQARITDVFLQWGEKITHLACHCESWKAPQRAANELFYCWLNLSKLISIILSCASLTSDPAVGQEPTTLEQTFTTSRPAPTEADALTTNHPGTDYHSQLPSGPYAEYAEIEQQPTRTPTAITQDTRCQLDTFTDATDDCINQDLSHECWAQFSMFDGLLDATRQELEGIETTWYDKATQPVQSRDLLVKLEAKLDEVQRKGIDSASIGNLSNHSKPHARVARKKLCDKAEWLHNRICQLFDNMRTQAEVTQVEDEARGLLRLIEWLTNAYQSDYNTVSKEDDDSTCNQTYNEIYLFICKWGDKISSLSPLCEIWKGPSRLLNEMRHKWTVMMNGGNALPDHQSQALFSLRQFVSANEADEVVKRNKRWGKLSISLERIEEDSHEEEPCRKNGADPALAAAEQPTAHTQAPANGGIKLEPDAVGLPDSADPMYDQSNIEASRAESDARKILLHVRELWEIADPHRSNVPMPEVERMAKHISEDIQWFANTRGDKIHSFSQRFDVWKEPLRLHDEIQETWNATREERDALMEERSRVMEAGKTKPSHEHAHVATAAGHGGIGHDQVTSLDQMQAEASQAEDRSASNPGKNEGVYGLYRTQ